MNQLIIETPDNNISQWTTNPLVIKLIHDRYHENIIEAVSIISTEIVNTFEIKDNMTIPYDCKMQRSQQSCNLKDDGYIN
ncbi:non-ribosomal peptide synthetase [Xenorhabdus cabanillasii JM26]|nr:non-ribosomal peptide synthetase [Xenorhabdus cabanillasii JM26]